MQEKTKKTTPKTKKRDSKKVPATSRAVMKEKARTTKKIVEKTSASKKASPKMKQSTPTLAEKLSEMTSTSSTNSNSMPKFSNKTLSIIFVIALVVFGLYLFKDSYIAAVVNGKPIFRPTLHMELEKQAGKQALEGLITKTLVFQEAQKQNIEVTQDEVDAQLSKIEESLVAQGQTLDGVIALQGLTKADVIEQVRLQLLIEKMVGDSVEVTDEEIADYMEQNADFLPEDANEEELKVSVKEQLKQQKLSAEIQTWIQGIQEEAEIKNYLFPVLEQPVTAQPVVEQPAVEQK